MEKLFTYLIFFSLFLACKNESGSQKSIEEIPSEGKISNIIRNPVSASEDVDTTNVAKMEFEMVEFDFGEVQEGDIVKHTYNFTNTGKVPLLISNARSTCGCTVPEWPKEPIAPGMSGAIDVEFNTKNKKHKQSKPVTITANTYPSQTKVILKGYVFPNPDTEDSQQ